MEAEISVLVQHRQSLQGHRHLCEYVEHVVHHAEQQRANEQGTVGFIFVCILVLRKTVDAIIATIMICTVLKM